MGGPQSQKPHNKVFLIFPNYTELLHEAIDAHGLKIQGSGYLKFLPKSLGGQGFQEKISARVPLFRV